MPICRLRLKISKILTKPHTASKVIKVTMQELVLSFLREVRTPIMVSTIGLGAGVECFVFFFLHLIPYKNNKSYPLYRKDKEQKKCFH